MRTDEQRQDKYDAKTVATTVSLKVASMLPSMKPAFAAAVQSFVAQDIQVQAALNLIGTVPTISYPLYYNFGREIWKLNQKGIAGTALTAMAISLSTKYQSYGCVEANLQTIAFDVFNIVIP
jgi:hypothetical protein